MPLMNIFEPLFLVLVLVTGIMLVAALVLALRGRLAKAGRLLRRLAMGGAVYFTAVIVASAVLPRREYGRGQPQCFDDWCITVLGGERVPGPGSAYRVSLRLSNRARRVPMGEKGTVAYLVDASGRRFDATTPSATVPFDTVLQPGASVESALLFDVPPDAARLALVYTHQGGFPIGWLIISEGGWLAKPSIMDLD
jgi:hypothetical protein